MDNYSKLYDSFKELLKQNLTADNADMITQMSTKLEELSQEHEKTVQENSSLKNKIVDYVKNTTFKEQPKEDFDDEEKDFGDLLAEEVNKIVSERK